MYNKDFGVYLGQVARDGWAYRTYAIWYMLLYEEESSIWDCYTQRYCSSIMKDLKFRTW